MVSEQEFAALIERVVEDCIPDEVDLFCFPQGRQLLQHVYATGEAPARNAKQGEFELVAEAKDILQVTNLAIATIKVLRAFFWPKETKTETVTCEIVQQEWSVKLAAQGLPPMLAAEVTAKFSQMLTELMARQTAATNPA